MQEVEQATSALILVQDLMVTTKAIEQKTAQEASAPSNLVGSIRRYDDNFQLGPQQDALECLQLIFKAISEERRLLRGR